MRYIISIVCFLFIIIPAYSNMIMDPIEYHLKIFFSQTDIAGVDAVLKGKIISFAAKIDYDKNDLLERAQDKSIATVRLYSKEGIKEGDLLYIINDKNLVVAKIHVVTIFKSNSFGYLSVGYGNFRFGSIGYRVVQMIEENNSQYAYIYKSRGDYYFNIGKEGAAISEYKKALTLDKGYPNAHLALGNIYYRQGLYQFAFKEYHEGYKRIQGLYDNEDKYLLLKGLADICFKEVYESYHSLKVRNRYRKEGIKYCIEALQIYSNSVDMHYLLGIFYYRTKNPSDKTARDHFLKVIELDPNHIDANIALSELYLRHKNNDKARMYIQNALKSDPVNIRARKILKEINK